LTLAGGDKPPPLRTNLSTNVVAGFRAKPDDPSILIFKGAPYPRLFLSYNLSLISGGCCISYQ
jgi:hypothetical protein